MVSPHWQDVKIPDVAGKIRATRAWYIEERIERRAYSIEVASPTAAHDLIDAGPMIEGGMVPDLTMHWQIETRQELYEVTTHVLTSIGVTAEPWTKGVNVAACHAGYSPMPEHAAPHLGCGCGFWGLTSPEPWIRAGFAGTSVYGVIEMWGEVIPGDTGWRSQYAEIVGIVSPSYGLGWHGDELRTLHDNARKAMQAYDVPALHGSMLDLTPPYDPTDPDYGDTRKEWLR